MAKYHAEIIYEEHSIDIYTMQPEGLLLVLERIGEFHFIRYREIPEHKEASENE